MDLLFIQKKILSDLSLVLSEGEAKLKASVVVFGNVYFETYKECVRVPPTELKRVL